jgi:hypothetical protein
LIAITAPKRQTGQEHPQRKAGQAERERSHRQGQSSPTRHFDCENMQSQNRKPKEVSSRHSGGAFF